MKSIKIIILMLALGALAFSSCKKSSTKPQTFKVDMSFKFNGVLKSAPSVFATYFSSQNALQIVGQVNTAENISIQIDTVRTGTFNVAGNGVIISYSPDNTFQNTYFGATGSVVISTFTNNTVTGTFSFVGQNSANVTGTVTQGTFSANLLKL